MAKYPFQLLTPSEAEEKLGKKYFYRQKIYRLGESGKIESYEHRGQTCFLLHKILNVLLKEVELKISTKYPEVSTQDFKIYYDLVDEKKIVVDGIFGLSVSVNTETETEEDLLQKIDGLINESVMNVVAPNTNYEDVDPYEEPADPSLADVLPEEIWWIKVDTKEIEGVEIKSLILLSLPSVAQFIGIRSDKFYEWIQQTTFNGYILSAHHKQFQAPEISVPWKKGVVAGYTPLIPFELLPEIIIAFRQSGRTVNYPQKAEQLYQIAQRTLEAIGLAISGDKNKAAEELAIVGQGLGLTAADQVVAIFKQYASRDFQVQTTKEFSSKVKESGLSYAITIGELTLGITGRRVEQWKTFGASRGLPAKIYSSSREVMRKLEPGDSVGMTFGEKHFIKQPNLKEAKETGRQGKEFFNRLKDVGLLED